MTARDGAQKPLSRLGRSVGETIVRRGLLASGDRIVVACSGGPDSVSLLLLLLELASERGYVVTAAHCNHGLRGIESDRDQGFTAELCRRLGVPFVAVRIDTAMGSGGGNLEQRGRIARYDALAGIAAGLDAVVATGHTLNDQAETFLMRLFRGSGPGGLSGVRSLRRHRDPLTGREVRVVRPLIETGREEVISYLQSQEQSWRSDETNADGSLDRNWIRREVLPHIQQRLNPRVVLAIARTADLMSEIEASLNFAARNRFQGEVRRSEDGITLPFAALARGDPALRRQMVRLLLQEAGSGLEGITLRQVDRILALGGKCSGRRIHLPGGIQAWNEFGLLRLTADDAVGEFSVPLPVPGEVVLEQLGKKVTAVIQPESSGSGRPTAVVTVRNRRPGDRIVVEEGTPPRRLKRLFNLRRIPCSERDKLLVIELEGRIVGIEKITIPGGTDLRLAPGISVRIETFPRQGYSK